MLDDIDGSLPVKLPHCCSLERVSETSVIIRADALIRSTNGLINSNLQDCNSLVRKWLNSIERCLPDWLVDYVVAYDSLLLEFDPMQIEFYGLIKYLQKVSGDFTLTKDVGLEKPGKVHRIEVCYQFCDQRHPNDMRLVEQQTALSSDQVIQLHQEKSYQVFAIGFMPNFAYLGEVDSALHVPRLKEPRLRVPAGAVAITDNQTAVYPNDSPGGWHIIGYTNFNFVTGINSAIGANDTVRFRAIDLQTFLQHKKRSSENYD